MKEVTQFKVYDFVELLFHRCRVRTVRLMAILTSCSNVLLRLPRVRGLSASMVDKANFLMKEQSYV